MSYKYSFCDNEIYSAVHVNNITKRLVTAGVEDSFTDGVAYNVSRFNEAGRLLYTAGVVPETCLTLKVIPSEEGKILINPGVAFFDDGSVIEIENGGEELTYIAGAKNYVYLKNDLINSNASYPCCTLEAPAGIYVPLAEIDENGAILDCRIYARGKLPGYQSVGGNVMVINDVISIDGGGRIISGSASFDIGANDFQYILVSHKGDVTAYNRNCLGLYNIAENRYIGFANKWDEESVMSENELYTFWSNVSGDTYRTVSFSLENGTLTVNMTAKSYKSYEQGTHTFPVELILF